MNCVTLEHFKRAAADIGSHGRRTMTRFHLMRPDNSQLSELASMTWSLAALAYDYFVQLDHGSHKQAADGN